MKKLFALAVLAGMAFVVVQSWPDIRRYVRMRAM